MKLKSIAFIVIILITGGITTGVQAQNTLKSLVKKCESVENVEMNIVRKKNKETLKEESSVITIKIRNNKALIDEFIAAFSKDEPAAFEAIYSKKEGAVVPRVLKFKNVSFTFSSQTKDGSGAYITMIENY